MHNSFSIRLKCVQCLRPQTHCLCAYVANIANRTHVLVLQHPNEHKHPLNTARLAVQGLKNAELLIGEQFTDLISRLHSVDKAFLLFPAQSHHTVQALAPLPVDSTSLLIVPDGTWRNVRKIIQLNPVLDTLPRLTLPLGEPSLYRIRKTKQTGAVSTIEAIARALTCLEPEHDYASLLTPFHIMVEQQIEAMGAEVYARNHK
ncbi:tRNA-uridine aminocarboxypropyltransferase [Paenalcaligenes hominis]|uniref:tRNA-uridine aminocarboxypropyltransferase n=1 Tax=Paenalcaligenes hominis TaxID=643674 RepID=UPI00352458C1